MSAVCYASTWRRGISLAQSLSHVQLLDCTDHSTPGLPVHHQLGACSNSCSSSWWRHRTIILCRPLLLLPSVFPSIRVFSNESALPIRWPKYWSFSFSISPSNEYLGLISFRMDWFDLLAVQGTRKSSPIPQFENFNSSVFNFLYSPTLRSIRDYWKNHKFDYMDLCQQSNVSAF